MTASLPDPEQLLRENEDLRRRIAELEAGGDDASGFSPLRHAIDATAWAIWEWRDLSRDEFYWSPSFFALLGYEPDELTPNMETFLSLTHPEDRQVQQEGVAVAVASREPFRSEYRMVSKSGDVVWVQAAGRTFYDGKGQPNYMAGLLRDITEERNLQDELARNERRLRTIVEAAPVGITIIGMEDLRFQDSNPAMCAMVGYTADELRRLSVPELTHPEDVQVDVDAYEKRLAGEMGLLMSEKRLIHKQGHEVWINAYTVPLEIVEGKPNSMLGIVVDLTESRRAETENAEAHRRLDLVVQSSRIGMWDWSIRTGALEVDEIWAGMIGYDLEELQPATVGTFFEALHPDDLSVSQQALNEHLRGETEYYECRLRFLHKQGNWIWILARGQVVEWTDSREPARMLGTHYEVTEIMEAEQRRLDLETQMLQTQKLESLGVLAGGIAHDFNNILMVIQGHVELAAFELPDSGPLRDSMRQIEASVEKASDLCAQMLAYSGRGSFLIGSVHLDDLIVDALPLLQSSVTRRVQLVHRTEGEIQPFQGDRTQIRQILMNLVINAAEAMEPAGGVVEILTGTRNCPALGAKCENDRLPPGAYTYLQVKDTGCGMDEETKRRVFEPFFTTKFTGRGLGMSAVQGIVRAHDGGLQLDSTPGEGSTFTILFPVAESTGDEALAEPAGRYASFRGEGLFLAVDDEPVVLRLARNMLERLGFTVLEAGGGHAAVELLEKHRDEIRGVLLDLTMPGLDGEATLHELRKLDPGVKVILCSGYSGKEIERRFFGKGLGGFLHKPYAMNDLRDAVARLLE